MLAVSHAILAHNRGRESGLADGIVATPSHNPPADGGFKYNGTNGGPADANVTRWIEDRANALLAAGNHAVKRMPYERARNSTTVHEHDFVSPYAEDLATHRRPRRGRGGARAHRRRSARRAQSDCGERLVRCATYRRAPKRSTKSTPKASRAKPTSTKSLSKRRSSCATRSSARRDDLRTRLILRGHRRDHRGERSAAALTQSIRNSDGSLTTPQRVRANVCSCGRDVQVSGHTRKRKDDDEFTYSSFSACSVMDGRRHPELARNARGARS